MLTGPDNSTILIQNNLPSRQYKSTNSVQTNLSASIHNCFVSSTCLIILSKNIDNDCAASVGAPDLAPGDEVEENSKLIATMPSSGVLARGCTSSPVIPQITFVFPKRTRVELSAVPKKGRHVMNLIDARHESNQLGYELG